MIRILRNKISTFVLVVFILAVCISSPLSAKNVSKLGNGYYGTHSDCGWVRVKRNKIIIEKGSFLRNLKNDNEIDLVKNNTISFSPNCKYYVQKAYINYSTGAEKDYKKQKCSKSKMLKILKKYKKSSCNYSWRFKIKKNKIIKLYIWIQRVKG